MSKSTHRVEVVPVRLEPHPNADALSVVHVWGYTVCVRTSEWEGRALGAYVVPDSVLPVALAERVGIPHEGKPVRVKVRRLRGVVSQGLLLPAPEGARIGDDVAQALGITRYEPPIPLSTGGEAAPPPPGYRPSYDVDSWHRYKHLFEPGEEVLVTEKIHGANGRFACADGQMHVGSRTEWKKDGPNIYWDALRRNPWIEPACVANLGLTLYGEIFGRVQDLRYGAGRNDLFVRLFDFWDAQALRWLNTDDWPIRDPAQVAPVLYRGPYSESIVRPLSEGPSLIPGANHMREGCVVRTAVERAGAEADRMVFKIVSDAYLERA